jgi:2-phospho-L-lactate transferase/gluconeogenesis factor (CofD/UPF0052 family)
VLFSGGRGSSALTRQLARHPAVSLTLAINGYDDGASTGEVRRFLGDSLGPSDFRKNASRLAGEWRTAPAALVELLDYRLPDAATAADALAFVAALEDRGEVTDALAAGASLGRTLPRTVLAPVTERLRRFESERASTGRPFRYGDCAIGNLVFAGAFLGCGRVFNAAVDDYLTLLGLPAGSIENVTDGVNAHLVALDVDGRVLGSEEEIVDAKRRNRIRDIFLIRRSLDEKDRGWLAGVPPEEADRFFAGLSVDTPLNPRLEARLATADLIVYAPGTQHSSLFPSYLTTGLSEALARNLTATKLLITNIQSDAEIAGASAVEIIERAVYYLERKGRGSIPTPCLITHYLLNDPGVSETDSPYVPLGRLDSLEDPRLVRIGSYEDGVTGRHSAARVLQPFLDSLAPRRRRLKIAVLLYEAGSANKITQSILEMVRGGLEDLAIDITVFYAFEPPLDAQFVASLPFAVRNLAGGGPAAEDVRLKGALGQEGFDYLVLFESSGMYRGDDVLGLLAHVRHARLDAVWGSRRLSVRDIEAATRLRYRHNVLLAAVSLVGSHLLSLAYLVAYGRYVFDTLSGVRVVRAADACEVAVPLTHREVNQHLLTGLLRRKADLIELPVRFFPLSPERVRRTSVWEGFQALGFILWRRLKGKPRTEHAGSSEPEVATSDRRSDRPSGA